MLKLLTVLGTFLLVALALLGLRQHRLELTAQTTAINTKIQERKESLLSQQVEITKVTNPWTLNNTLQDAGMNTGAALSHLGPASMPAATRRAAPSVPTGASIRPTAPETDLVPQAGGGGHTNPNRPRGN